MDSSDILSSLIEVGIGIAGFASIVVALRSSEVDPRTRLVFLQLCLQSAAIIIFSALPLLLGTTNIDEAHIYTYASGIYGIYLAITIPVALYHQRLFVPLVAKIIISTYPIIVICNAVWFGLVWPYILVLLGGVLGAIFSFYLLVTSTWTSEDDA